MKYLGVVLIVVGLAMLIIRGFNVTEKEKVLDLGKLEVNKSETKTVSWPLYVGGVAIVAGIAIMLVGKKGS